MLKKLKRKFQAINKYRNLPIEVGFKWQGMPFQSARQGKLEGGMEQYGKISYLNVDNYTLCLRSHIWVCRR